MPVADAGFRLPGVGQNRIRPAALVIGHHRFGQIRGNTLAVDDTAHLPAVPGQALVVVIGADVHSTPAQGEQGGVKIKQIGIVLVHQIARAVVEILDVGNIRQGVSRVFGAVEKLRVKALPPQAAAVGKGQMAVIRLAGQGAGGVSAVGDLKVSSN